MKKYEKELLEHKFFNSTWGGCLVSILACAVLMVLAWAVFSLIGG